MPLKVIFFLLSLLLSTEVFKCTKSDLDRHTGTLYVAIRSPNRLNGLWLNWLWTRSCNQVDSCSQGERANERLCKRIKQNFEKKVPSHPTEHFTISRGPKTFGSHFWTTGTQSINGLWVPEISKRSIGQPYLVALTWELIDFANKATAAILHVVR